MRAALKRSVRRRVDQHYSQTPSARHGSCVGRESFNWDVNVPNWRKSSIFLRRMIGSMFMRVHSKCAHHQCLNVGDGRLS